MMELDTTEGFISVCGPPHIIIDEEGTEEGVFHEADRHSSPEYSRLSQRKGCPRSSAHRQWEDAIVSRSCSGDSVSTKMGTAGWVGCIDHFTDERTGVYVFCLHVFDITHEFCSPKAVQIFDVLRAIGGYHNFSAGLVIGGKSLKDERERLDRMNILVATPGRLLQHMDQTFGFDGNNLQVLGELRQHIHVGCKLTGQLFSSS